MPKIQTDLKNFEGALHSTSWSMPLKFQPNLKRSDMKSKTIVSPKVKTG